MRIPIAMKKTKQIGLRLTDEEYERFVKVQEHIVQSDPRKREVDIVGIIRSMLGLGNSDLVTVEEREYIAGKRADLHGQFTPERKRNKS